MKYLMSNAKNKVVVHLLLLCFLCLMFHRPVSAQQISLSITPPILELVIKPGKSVMIAYQVSNQGDPVILTTKLVSFEPRDNFGKIRLKDGIEGPIRFELDNSDIQLERPFFLKTGASQQLLLRIRAPEGAANGDYYYTLLAETTPVDNIDGTAGPKTKASIGSNILVTVTDSGVIDIRPKVVLFEVINKLKMFNQKIKIFDSFDKIPLVLIVENKGKNLIKPEGKISLIGNFGERIDYPIIPKNILSESQRLVEASSSANPLEQRETSYSTVFSGFFIGQYRVTTEINFGESSPTLFAKTSFFAFPFKLAAVLFLTVGLIVFIVGRFFTPDSKEQQ